MNVALRLLTSARFAITIIAFIILLSIAGTLLPNGSVIFSSPFFVALIALFSLSTLICSLTKIRTVWDLVVHPRVDVTDQFVEALPLHAFIPGAKLSDVSEHIKGYSRRRSTNTDEATLFAQRGGIGRIGPHIAHFGILLLLLGVLIGIVNGSMSGYNNSIAVIPQGGSAEVGGFTLKLNDFVIDYYSDGSIREYKAMVSIIDGTAVENYYITVNEPLTYKGLTFYLYDYDSVGVAQSGKASWVAFQIKSEAGIPLIWAGAFTTIVGIMVALYIPHKRIWIKESDRGLLLGGNSNKRSRSFLKDMEKIRSAATQDSNHTNSKTKQA
ncbi:MAG: cytochrome c biogenesis protein ResB [Halobacteriota archaeon]